MRSLVVLVLAFALANGSDLTEKYVNETTECIKNIFNEGRPSIGLPSFNPLVIEHKAWNLDNLGIPGISGAISFDNFVMRNMYNYYLSFIEIEETANGHEVETVTQWDNLDYVGDYSIDIDIFGITLKGAGKVSEEIVNYANDIRQAISNEGVITAVETLVRIEEFKFHVDEVILNDEDITDYINEKANQSAEWMNENSELIGSVISNIIIMIVNGDINPFPSLSEVIVNECY